MARIVQDSHTNIQPLKQHNIIGSLTAYSTGVLVEYRISQTDCFLYKAAHLSKVD